MYIGRVLGVAWGEGGMGATSGLGVVNGDEGRAVRSTAVRSTTGCKAGIGIEDSGVLRGYERNHSYLYGRLQGPGGQFRPHFSELRFVGPCSP